MKLVFRYIRAWLTSQKNIYFLLTLLAIVPNIALAITNDEPILVNIASILIPTAIIMIVLLLAKKPGIPNWVLLPKVILDGGQMVLLYLFGESVIAVDMFLNLTSSNASEASELLGNIFVVILCVFFLYTLPTLLLATHSIKIKNSLSNSFRMKVALVGLGTFVTGMGLCMASAATGHRCVVKDDIYPINAIYNLCFAIKKADRNAHYTETSKDFKFDSRRTNSANGREIYVLVVGETSRAMEWSLYGYERETTPNLKKLDRLVAFSDATTQSNNTHKSVPIILSAASAENYDVLWQQKSVVTAFKEAGFKTLVVANQKLNTSIIWSFYKEADKFIDMNKYNTSGSILQSLYDGEMLSHIKSEIDFTPGNMFIVLHTYGSHFNYHERYPKEFKRFMPDKAEGIRETYKRELRNAYDNSILYTDHVLTQIVSMLDSTEACCTMMYLSDHGEDIFDDSRKRYLHASPIPTYYQMHIPYIIWFSKSYVDTFSDKYATAVSNMRMPVSTNSVFHTLLDLANIDSPQKNLSYSVCSKSFAPTIDRKYLGDHDDPLSFKEIGLKRQDFEMLDKRGMKYPHE